MMRYLTGLRFRYHWFLVVLMGLVIPLATSKTEKPGEFYPFSNFPMYSRFEPETYYVYVTSEKGDLVPVGPMFGRSISDVKKAYDRKLSNLKKSIKGVRKVDMPADKKAEAAKECLQWLVEITPPVNQDKLKALGTIHMHEVQIEFVDGKINKADTLVGSLSLQPTKLP
ncbi:MAG: hypothetical protein JNM99_02285 [Verrucomicrobiaceae bacterium]|nr:hypothetical protein [Verrucomicrobiaceae bacterium]